MTILRSSRGGDIRCLESGRKPQYAASYSNETSTSNSSVLGYRNVNVTDDIDRLPFTAPEAALADSALYGR